MERAKKVEEQNIDAELEFEIEQAHHENKADREAKLGNGGVVGA
jgi:HAE1 family hydrophobic/amphiphilic exporter-1